MKTIILIASLLFLQFDLSAQDMILSFQPNSESSPIDSIRATNLRTNESVKLSGNYLLKLADTSTGIDPEQQYLLSGSIYPNPSSGIATIMLPVKKDQLVEISMFNSEGQLVNKKVQRLVTDVSQFSVSFQRNGIYVVSVRTSEGIKSLKIVCTGVKTFGNNIEYVGTDQTPGKTDREFYLKNTMIPDDIHSESDMGVMLHYIPGDYIYFDFYSWYMNLLRESIFVDQPKQTDPQNNSDTIKYGVDFHECIDADGNHYKVVKIGDQTWMAENLKTTSYRNGDEIPYVTDKNEWAYRDTNAYCWFNNDLSNKSIYGALYNRFAVVENRNPCPVGWHIPKEEEWRILLDYLGGLSVASGKMRESDLSHWASPNLGATNESGFSALPGGYRSGSDGSFRSWYNAASWWTTTNSIGTCWVSFNLQSAGSGGFYCEYEQKGMHVRCVMD